jgi:general secretion pathway protein E|tara:strand:+ start:271 stop:1527 length:1257 start_codon:yes stop_codon:yes gene_type:complete
MSSPRETSTEISRLDPLDDNFAVAVVDALLALAIQRDASDIHLQPRGDGWDVLFRIDGVLSVTEFLKGGGASDPVTRLMVLAGLPTYRSGTPMEGRLNLKSDTAVAGVSMRLGVYPTVHGPRGVVRILRHHSSHETIETLGLGLQQQQALADLCGQTDGIVLLSGPAGSGKTTTMYALLRDIASRRPRRSVMTIEDPVESVVDTISQSELDPVGGMTLGAALRSAVRQDSEVLLVSEIRDPETAEAAMQASLTGHLIFSSLHSSDVASSLRRLTQLGVPHHLVRSGVRAIINQRLLRRLCGTCQQGQAVSNSGLVSNSVEDTNRLNACPDCAGTGYRGRIAIAQIVRIDGNDPVGDALADSLEAGDPVQRMRLAAKAAGAVDLHETAGSYVEQGITDRAEVYRVLGKKDGNGAQQPCG